MMPFIEPTTKAPLDYGSNVSEEELENSITDFHKFADCCPAQVTKQMTYRYLSFYKVGASSHTETSSPRQKTAKYGVMDSRPTPSVIVPAAQI
jgi:hypothetical protein